jgi:multidrug efflux pump subunit AcrB
MKNSLRSRFNISRFAIRYPWLTISFWIAVCVAGLLAFSSLKYALFPDVAFPVVIVNATTNLENTLETETKLTKPLESSILAIDGIEQVYSSIFPSQTVISAVFFGGENLTDSTEKVKSALKNIPLPPDTSVEVFPFNLNESTAISYALSSDNKTLTELEDFANKTLIPPLQKIPGVLQVNLLGVIANQENNSNLPTNNLSTLVRFNGEDSLAIQVVKEGAANTLDVVKKVEQEIAKLTPQLSDIKLTLAQTEADYIKEATQSTIDALIQAIVLAILIIFPFLGNFSATLITALAIPLSLLGTCIVMRIANFNLETITLLALALVIGIVVDDAIVDVENIARHIEKGETPKQAAILGTDEIGLTVSASTLTIVAVFLPVAFMGNTIGQFFKPFGLTVSAAVIISLLVARTLSPVLAIYWLKPTGKKVNFNLTSLNNFGHKFIQKYRNLLSWSLEHRKLIVLFAFLSFIAGLALIPFIPQGFIPQLDRGEFNVIYTTNLPKIPSNWNLNQSETQDSSSSQDSSFSWLGNIKENPNGFILRRTRRIGEKIEQVLLESPEIESTFNIVGFREQPNKGKIYVKLKENRTLNTAQVQQQIRDSLPKIKGTKISVEDIKFVDTGDEQPVKLALVGDNLQSLNQTALKVKNILETFPGLVDVTSSVTEEKESNDNDIFMIEHRQGQRSAVISANLAEGNAIGNLTSEIVTKIKPILPNDVQLELEGDSGRVGSILGDFGITSIFSVTLMLLLLLLLFGRLLEPLVVGLSLPFCIVGAMFALLITGSDFGMISLIGLIFLLGLLDKNVLLLIDYTNQLRLKGMERKEAILETGLVRLRPIFMTTFSTILGMLPLALGWGAGAELRQPMAVAIIGGLFTSTFLTLIFVPVFYTLVEDLWLKFFPSQQE